MQLKHLKDYSNGELAVALMEAIIKPVEFLDCLAEKESIITTFGVITEKDGFCICTFSGTKIVTNGDAIIPRDEVLGVVEDLRVAIEIRKEEHDSEVAVEAVGATDIGEVLCAKGDISKRTLDLAVEGTIDESLVPKGFFDKNASDRDLVRMNPDDVAAGFGINSPNDRILDCDTITIAAIQDFVKSGECPDKSRAIVDFIYDEFPEGTTEVRISEFLNIGGNADWVASHYKLNAERIRYLKYTDWGDVLRHQPGLVRLLDFSRLTDTEYAILVKKCPERFSH